MDIKKKRRWEKFLKTIRTSLYFSVSQNRKTNKYYAAKNIKPALAINPTKVSLKNILHEIPESYELKPNYLNLFAIMWLW